MQNLHTISNTGCFLHLWFSKTHVLIALNSAKVVLNKTSAMEIILALPGISRPTPLVLEG